MRQRLRTPYAKQISNMARSSWRLRRHFDCQRDSQDAYTSGRGVFFFFVGGLGHSTVMKAMTSAEQSKDS